MVRRIAKFFLTIFIAIILVSGINIYLALLKIENEREAYAAREAVDVKNSFDE